MDHDTFGTSSPPPPPRLYKSQDLNQWLTELEVIGWYQFHRHLNTFRSTSRQFHQPFSSWHCPLSFEFFCIFPPSIIHRYYSQRVRPKMPTNRYAHEPICPRTDMPTDRYAHGPICQRTDVPTDRCAHGPICPRTDMPTDRYANGPICPRTDMPTDRYAHGPICPRTYMPTDLYAHGLTLILTMIGLRANWYTWTPENGPWVHQAGSWAHWASCSSWRSELHSHSSTCLQPKSLVVSRAAVESHMLSLRMGTVADVYYRTVTKCHIENCC